MRNEEIELIRSGANAAYKSRDFKRALELSRILVTQDVPEAFLTCGLIVEHGWHGEAPDLASAAEYYSALAIRFDESEGYLGFARLALKRQRAESARKAEKFCASVIGQKKDPIAYLLLGRVYEELFGSSHFELARRNYLLAGLRGSAWAWRRYAQLQCKSGHVVLGGVAHVWATIVSPFLVLFGGLRASRQG